MEEVISQRVQDSFVLLAITSTKFLKATRKTVKPSYFSSTVTEDLITWCYSYFDQFESAPGNHFHDELERHLSNKKEEQKELYISYLVRLQEQAPADPKYILKRINDFIHAREFEEASIKFAEFTAVGKFEKARELMTKALRSGIAEVDDGLDYFSSMLPSYLGEGADGDRLMGLGVPYLDNMLPRGLCRSDSVTVLGGFKGRKSWFMFHLGREGLINGLKVLHISHEMSRNAVEQRYDRILGRLTSEKHAVMVPFEEFDEEGRVLTTNQIRIPSVHDCGEVPKARRKALRYGGRLWLKKYPPLTATMDEIERYLDHLETYHGYSPDVIINDYIEKMRLPSNIDRRDGIHEYYMVTKRIADERNILMVTVSQVNRQSLRKKILDQAASAEDIRKIGDVDLALGISQTTSQARSNSDRMQLYVLANREGKQDMGCSFNAQLDAGQLVLHTWPLKLPRSHDDDEDWDHDE